MDDRIKYIDAFNTKMDDFIKDLGNLVCINPDISKEVTALSSGMRMAKNINVCTPCEMFYRTVAVPYGDRILKNDDEFFLSQTYNGVCSNSIVDALKTLWKSMTPEDKDHVKKHMTLLVKLSQLAYAEAQKY